MGSVEWMLLALLSVLWGGSFFFTELALRELGPLTVVLGRVSFAAFALVLFVYIRGHRMPKDATTWISLVVMGAINNVIPFTLIVWGQLHIDSGLASILNATTPLFTIILAHFLTSDERLTSSKMLGVSLGFVGIIALIGPIALKGFGLGAIGQLAVLGAAISYAFAGIFGKRLKKLPTSVAAAGMLTGSTLMMLLLAVTLEDPFAISPGITSWIAILGISLLSTALAYLIYFRILAVAGATNLLLVTFLIPISALLLGVFVLNERLQWNAAVGMAVIFLGLAAVDGRLWPWIRRRTR